MEKALNPGEVKRTWTEHFSVVEVNPSQRYGVGKLTYSPERYPDGLLEHAAEIIQSGECMLDITDSDDGCIDGRVATIVSFLGQHGVFESSFIDNVDDYNHVRSKVAGGGALTGLVAQLAVSRQDGETVDEALERLVIALARQDIFVGAHTGSHGGEDTTDCGANDSVEGILSNGQRLKTEVGGTLREMMQRQALEFDHQVFKEVVERLNSYGQAGFFEGSSGKSRLEAIKRGIVQAREISPSDKPRAVIKHLDSEHFEAFVVRNFVKGKTFSQRQFRQELHRRFPEIPPEQLPEVFTIDIPRVIQLAAAVAETTEEFDRAFMGALLFQEAALATLTDGSLRQFEISQAA